MKNILEKAKTFLAQLNKKVLYISVGALAALAVILTVAITSCDKPDENPVVYKYTDFTAKEKQVFTDNIGEVIPFIESNEYYVEGIAGEYDFSKGIVLTSEGNSKADFEQYLVKLANAGYKLAAPNGESSVWYVYNKADITLEVTWYTDLVQSHFELRVYLPGGGTGNNGGNGGNQGGTGGDNTGNNGGNDGGDSGQTQTKTINYNFNNALPSGVTYDNGTYSPEWSSSTGAIKLRFEGISLITEKFTSSSSVKVNIVIAALNSNTKTATSSDVFTVVGFDASGNEVARGTLTSVAVGNNIVTLTGNGIVSVKVTLTGYPQSGGSYCNVNISDLNLELN